MSAPHWEDEFVEKAAALEHARWARWQRYLFTKCIPTTGGALVIPQPLVERWIKQIETPYERLSEEEKESDREQVREYLPLVKKVAKRTLNRTTP